jgi:hypothetical protein
MSITVTTDVFCDHEDCLQWTFGAVGERVQARAARARARTEEGWTVREGLDICPRHNLDYLFVGPYGCNAFALHEHPSRGVRHGHDGGALPHVHEPEENR